MGNVVLEAMASRLPVVEVNKGGVKENIIHNFNGYLAENENPIEIMNLGLGLQTLSALRHLEEIKLTNEMINVPDDISKHVSELSLGFKTK